MLRYCQIILASVLSLAAVGCGRGGPPLGYVTGTVTLNGETVQGATIMIDPAEGAPSRGISDAQGNYEMQFKFDTPGAQVGTHPIRVSVPFESTLPEYFEQMDIDQVRMLSEKTDAENPVPKSWRDGTKTITVESGSNTFNIDLIRESAGG